MNDAPSPPCSSVVWDLVTSDFDDERGLLTTISDLAFGCDGRAGRGFSSLASSLLSLREDQNDDSVTASVLDLLGLGRLAFTPGVSITSKGSSSRGSSTRFFVVQRFRVPDRLGGGRLGASVEMEVEVDATESTVDDLSLLFFLENQVPIAEPRILTVSVALGSISPGLC